MHYHKKILLYTLTLYLLTSLSIVSYSTFTLQYNQSKLIHLSRHVTLIVKNAILETLNARNVKVAISKSTVSPVESVQTIASSALTNLSAITATYYGLEAIKAQQNLVVIWVLPEYLYTSSYLLFWWLSLLCSELFGTEERKLQRRDRQIEISSIFINNNGHSLVILSIEMIIPLLE